LKWPKTCPKERRDEGRRVRSTRTYVLMELGELLLLIVLISVISRFIYIPLWIAIAIPAGKLLKFVLVYPLVRRSFKQPIYSGLESLIGRQGLAMESLDPEGYVSIRGELWKAFNNGPPISAGAKVEVCELEGTKLVVKEIN
jgi:membrane-bound ClpP family serine protease